VRLFVGVELPENVKDALWDLQERNRAAAPDAKWVPRDNLHLTMSFLGEVDEARVDPIREALHEAAAPGPDVIPTALRSAGAFPNPRRARVVWVGLDDDNGHLAALAGSVAAGLEQVGFAREERPWSAHLTVARLRVARDVGDLLGTVVRVVAFDVDVLTLFRSRLGRPAPIYDPVARIALGTRNDS